ncbi:MAG: TIGR01777 family oxidoreductase [Bdellovibrionales bacterium]
MKILMTGATGLIGKELGIELTKQGHQVLLISRDRQKAEHQAPFPCQVIEGDLSSGPIQDSRLSQVEVVIHLLGESVAEKRWSKAQKNKILDSRVKSTQHLIASLTQAPKAFLSASAVGFYGDRKEEELAEDSAPGRDFLAGVCVAWENAVDQIHAKFQNTRIVKMRIGLVLSAQGGALEKMLPPFQAGFGGALGNGRQWMSWIHIQDLVSLFMHALNNASMSGAVNAVAPKPEINRDFSKLLAQSVRRWLGPSIPGPALKILFGEMAQVLLASQKALPQKALQSGFVFQFPDLSAAFKNILAAQRQGEEFFVTKQYLPQPPEEVFRFFSRAENLESITPDILNFKVIGMTTEKIQKDTLIDYKLKIRGIPAHWRTKIETWNPPHDFVDTSLKGPYRLWHHTHTFEKLGPGTLMTDRVRYVLPLGYMGWLAAVSLVKSDVKAIFDFRRQVTAKIFTT